MLHKSTQPHLIFFRSNTVQPQHSSETFLEELIYAWPTHHSSRLRSRQHEKTFQSGPISYAKVKLSRNSWKFERRTFFRSWAKPRTNLPAPRVQLFDESTSRHSNVISKREYAIEHRRTSFWDQSLWIGYFSCCWCSSTVFQF